MSIDRYDQTAGSIFPTLLAAFGADAADLLSRQLEIVSIAGGQILFSEGDEADALYIVASGSVGISTEDEGGQTRRIARVGPPETIGELAFLADARRSATATALRDCVLLRISRTAFDEVVTQFPEATLRIARLLARRGQQANTVHRKAGTASSTIAVLPVTAGVSAPALARDLAHLLEGRSLVLESWPEGCDEAQFHRFEAAHRHVVYTSDDIDDPWGRLCHRRADHVVLLAAVAQPLRSVDSVARVLGSSPWQRQDLVVVQDAGAAMPAPVSDALDRALGANNLRVQIRRGDRRDLARLARVVTGRTLGIVLSGGGARGFAHLGALRALDEAGIRADLIGGTSIGAIIGAAFAMGWGLDEMSERIVEAFVTAPPLNDYTLPLVAITRGLKVDRALARHFGDARIEDLWHPFFCVSTNLSTGAALVHRRGPLARALRASVAIPGLLPPVLAPEGVLVDGAMINNLPVDVIAGIDRGRILAVDVASDVAMLGTPRRSWRNQILRRWLDVPHAMPGVTEILLRAATVSSDLQANLARAQASLVIRPPLADVDLRAWRSYERIARIGYEHTSRMIEAGLLTALAPTGPMAAAVGPLRD